MKIANLNPQEVARLMDTLARSADKAAKKRGAGSRRAPPIVTEAAPVAKPAAKTAKKSTAADASLVKAAGEVRIIGGQWKRTKLAVAKHPGLRPTPDRVRETVFNWLGQDMTGLRCVDAFAGTGALGLEAASRGAADVLLVESEAKLITQLTNLKTKLKADMVRIQRGDGIAVLNALPRGSVDVVFIDPPFEAPIYDKAIAAAAQALSAQGAIYLEAPKTWTNDDLAALGLHVVRSGKAGMVHYHLLSHVLNHVG
jgi:16S rRNA (guanine966-N2)-methyltransferase